MNMKEIAQLAGVTAATVSNAINGTGNVSEKKRKEIMEIIEKEERNGCHPKKLGHAICKIVACKNPPFRTKVGPWIQVTFAKSKKWLPDVVMQYALRIFYAIQ